MFDKLQMVEERYEEISKSLTDPAAVSDNQAYKSYMKELKSLTPVVDAFRDYKAAKEKR